MCLVLRATTESEKKFYELLSHNAETSIKDLCRQIPRRTVYKHLKEIMTIQATLNEEILEKKAGICSRTGMPIMILEMKSKIEIKDSPNGAFVCFNGESNHPPDKKDGCP